MRATRAPPTSLHCLSPSSSLLFSSLLFPAVLMFNGFKNAIMRPQCCTTSVAPCTLEMIRFFFRQEIRDRNINGKRRLNWLKQRFKPCVKACKSKKEDEFYGIGQYTGVAMQSAGKLAMSRAIESARATGVE